MSYRCTQPVTAFNGANMLIGLRLFAVNALNDVVTFSPMITDRMCQRTAVAAKTVNNGTIDNSHVIRRIEAGIVVTLTDFPDPDAHFLQDVIGSQRRIPGSMAGHGSTHMTGDTRP